MLAEDNPADKLLFEIGLKNSRLNIELHWVQDGVEVMNFLRKDGKYHNAPKPNIAILDLNMPRKSGVEVVEEIKADEELKDILTIVLTTSDAQSDMRDCYDVGADKFMVKPLEFTGIKDIVKEIESLWLEN